MKFEHLHDPTFPVGYLNTANQLDAYYRIMMIERIEIIPYACVGVVKYSDHGIELLNDMDIFLLLLGVCYAI